LLDRGFEPPAPVRLVLLAGSLTLLVVFARRVLLHPLRRRPGPRDLAAIWERSHPALQDRLATTVELADPASPSAGIFSPALLAKVADETAGRLGTLDPAVAAPSGRARRSAALGLGAAGVLVVLASLAPGEASIFLQRLFGGSAPWPHDTHLVLLAPHAEGHGAGPELVVSGPESFRAQVARGTVLTVRLRAEGVVPERVEALVAGVRRPMRPLGDGEFVLRLAPLTETQTMRFHGGDDDDNLPQLVIEPGIAPAITDWTVSASPPAYTGRAAQDSPMNEFRVPQGTLLAVRFRTDRPRALAFVRDLGGETEQLAMDAAGWWSFEAVALRSGEKIVETEGPDGFRDPRAAVLRWHADPDRAPQLEFLEPAEAWTSVAGGRIPLLLAAKDDYELVAARFGAEGAAESPAPLALQPGVRDFLHFETLTAPPPGEGVEGGPRRFRLEAWAEDAAEPEPQQGHALSAWIEVVSPEVYETRLGERMVAAREIVERVLERTREFEREAGSAPAEGPANRARRIQRDLLGLQKRLERNLMERVYTGLDRGSRPAADRLDALLARGAPETGAATTALLAGTPPLERAGLLLDLARAASQAREGAAERLAAAIAAGEDPAPVAAELRIQLESMLEIFLTWEDFQSAINLLRGLLERQRSLYLRTREASDR
ncbi:MAG TPA: hypothetical protein VGC54_11030, partial [Planctomycetota bacterium]